VDTSNACFVSQRERLRARSCPARPNARRKSGHALSRANEAAKLATVSPRSRTGIFTPELASTISPGPPQSKQITGTPRDMASSNADPPLSRRAGNTNASACS